MCAPEHLAHRQVNVSECVCVCVIRKKIQLKLCAQWLIASIDRWEIQFSIFSFPLVFVSFFLFLCGNQLLCEKNQVTEAHISAAKQTQAAMHSTMLYLNTYAYTQICVCRDVLQLPDFRFLSNMHATPIVLATVRSSPAFAYANI